MKSSSYMPGEKNPYQKKASEYAVAGGASSPTARRFESEDAHISEKKKASKWGNSMFAPNETPLSNSNLQQSPSMTPLPPAPPFAAADSVPVVEPQAMAFAKSSMGVLSQTSSGASANAPVSMAAAGGNDAPFLTVVATPVDENELSTLGQKRQRNKKILVMLVVAIVIIVCLSVTVVMQMKSARKNRAGGAGAAQGMEQGQGSGSNDSAENNMGQEIGTDSSTGTQEGRSQLNGTLAPTPSPTPQGNNTVETASTTFTFDLNPLFHPSPSAPPTKSPTGKPTKSPTKKPTPSPVAVDQTGTVTQAPTDPQDSDPMPAPTPSPVQMPNPTRSPTKSPTKSPTRSPTRQPTPSPTENPSASPSSSPEKEPTAAPSMTPSSRPSPPPVPDPTRQPTRSPVTQASVSPTRQPQLVPDATTTVAAAPTITTTAPAAPTITTTAPAAPTITTTAPAAPTITTTAPAAPTITTTAPAAPTTTTPAAATTTTTAAAAATTTTTVAPDGQGVASTTTTTPAPLDLAPTRAPTVSSNSPFSSPVNAPPTNPPVGLSSASEQLPFRSITTTYDADTSGASRGNMFDVSVKVPSSDEWNAVYIHSIDINISAEPGESVTVQVFTRDGSYQGVEVRAEDAGWERLVNGMATIAKGQGLATELPLNQVVAPIRICRGAQKAFYIFADRGENGERYRMLSTPYEGDSSVYENEDLQIEGGTANGRWFGEFTSGMMFSGALHYAVQMDEDC